MIYIDPSDNGFHVTYFDPKTGFQEAMIIHQHIPDARFAQEFEFLENCFRAIHTP